MDDGDMRQIPMSVNYAQVPERAINHELGIHTCYPVGSYSSQADSVVRVPWKSSADNIFVDPLSSKMLVTYSVPDEVLDPRGGAHLPFQYSFDVGQSVYLCAKGANTAAKVMYCNFLETIGEYILSDGQTEIFRIKDCDSLMAAMMCTLGNQEAMSKYYMGLGGFRTSDFTGQLVHKPIECFNGNPNATTGGNLITSDANFVTKFWSGWNPNIDSTSSDHAEFFNDSRDAATGIVAQQATLNFMQHCFPPGIFGHYNPGTGSNVPARPYSISNATTWFYDGDGTTYNNGRPCVPANFGGTRSEVIDTTNLSFFPPCLVGTHKPISDIYSSTSLYQMFSRVNIPTIHMGKPALKAVTKRRVIIPVPDFIFGFLVDPNKFKLVPLAAFKQPVAEIRFTKDAFTSSWWTSNLDCKRYNIEDIQLQYEWMMIYDRNVMLAQEAMFSVGITLSFTGWYQCLQQNIVGGGLPTNLQINVGFDSMTQFLFFFIPTDYQKFACYRKHYFINAGIKTYQLKFGTKFIPSLPVRGNSGNSDGVDTNYEFYYETCRAFGVHVGKQNMGFNNWSAAFQDREYYDKDAETLGALYSTSNVAFNANNYRLNQRGDDNGISLLDYLNYSGPESTYGTATADKQVHVPILNAAYQRNEKHADVAQCFLHTGYAQRVFFTEQNLPKCIYSIDCDSLNYERSHMSGISTVAVKPWELLLTTDSKIGIFPRDYRFYCYGKYDGSVVLTPTQTLVYGVQ